MKNITKFFFPTLVMITAIGLAITAAYFSVTGLSKLFAGAKEAVIVMASILELAKIVTASWLHRHWLDGTISRVLKIQLSIVVFVLMCITSAGIYGFLSSAYFETSSKLSKIDTEISLLDKQKVIFDGKINNLNNLKKAKTDRIQSLTTLRSQQESRIDSLYKKNMISAVKRTEAQIKEANNEINVLLKEADDIDRNIQTQNDSITKIELRKVDVADDDVASEIGPLKYIAKLTGASMDSVINWFILALIFVFDPLAIALIIAANITSEKTKKQIEEEQIKSQIKQPKIEEEVVVKENVDAVNDAERTTMRTAEEATNEVTKEVTGVATERATDETIDTPTKTSEEKDSVLALEELETNKIEDKLTSKISQLIEESEKKEEEFKKKMEELSKKHEEITDNSHQEYAIFDLEKKEETNNQTNDISKEVVEYTEFQEVDEKQEIDEKVQRDTLYLKFLTTLFRGGSLKEGDELPVFTEFVKDLDSNGVKYKEKEIRDFLTACNLLKIIDTSKGKRITLKSFDKAKELISNI